MATNERAGYGLSFSFFLPITQRLGHHSGLCKVGQQISLSVHSELVEGLPVHVRQVHHERALLKWTLHTPCFDDQRLVNNAGLLLPATLALCLGFGELVDQYVDLRDAPGRANPSDNLMTLAPSALAGGDCIDDADALRTGAACALGNAVKALSTLGTFLRSFRWGHVRQLDRVSSCWHGPWKAGAGPGDALFTIDLDYTIYKTYGLAKEGARHHGYTGALVAITRCWPSLPVPRRVDVPSARGPRQHRSGRRPLPAGDRGTGAPCWGQGTTHGAGRQRLLYL